MKYIVTSEEMKKYDRFTIEEIGIPGMVLMERAALAVSEQISRILSDAKPEDTRVLIMAGMGNNGGDGLALARLLSEKGYSVTVWCVGKEEKASAQWRQQREILRKYPVATGTKDDGKEYTILVDALFGVGLSREVEGEYAEAINAFNQKSAYKLAVDIPSGLDADTGRMLGCAVRADMTVTFGFGKRGLVMFPGCEYTGEIIVADIGISEHSFAGEVPGMFCYEEEAVELMPRRRRDGNKGTFGKVLMVAGSVNMAGAAILAGKAAYRAGAGMVKLITPQENRVILQETLPEALLGSLNDLKESLNWADVVAIGPGIGKSEAAKKCLRTVLEQEGYPLLIDADGLNLLAEDSDLRKLVKERRSDVIFTPHVGELGRLTGKSVKELKRDLSASAMDLARELKAIIVAKDARTFICKENMPICINIRGNSGMATAGSGDVLAGMIAAFLAQGMNAFEAACVGVYIHACAGENASLKLGEHGVMAGDIAEAVAALQ